MKYETCGPYLLLEKLASGGMAEVFLAKASGAEGVSKYLAIKKILPQYSSNDEFVDMFKSEAKIAININHVNIVPMYEFGETGGQFYLAMEFILGKNLRQVASKIQKQKKPVALEHILFIINEVAKGLDYAHRFIDRTTGKPLNIIHRDMSPQNIMLSYEGEVKIVDFGIAKAESKLEATQAGTLKGKFGYMSPEQVEGLELDYRTDIFSLGTILWELVAHERLFAANNEINTIKKIKECKIPPLTKLNPSVDDELERIANKALARDRSLRYQSASEMHRDLNRYLNKHYSDYTSQDFAQFVKQLYLKEIMEMREKLMDYAKVQVPKNIVENSDVTRTITHTASDIQETKIPEPISTTEINFENNISLDDSSLSLRRGRNTYYPVPIHTNATSSDFTKSVLKPKRNYPMLFSSIFIIALTFYLHSNPQALNTVKTNLGLETSTQELTSKSPLENTIKESKKYIFYVKSNPTGAKIYINENDSGYYTPGRIKVTKNESFNLTLRKDGFIEYRKQITPTDDGQQFKATLQKAKTGFLSIYVPTPNTEIYINGAKISEKPPITKYAIQAADRVVIKAVNPYTKASDTTTIRVREDTHQRINLFPKK